MKIIFTRLKNFIGVSEGMGRKEIIIDLSAPNTPEIILLVGGNGKGKTTLLSHMQPFASNNDGREFTVFPNEDGEKEIRILDGETQYWITHYYNKKKDGGVHTVKSFIDQHNPDGTIVALNEGGGVRSFADVLKKHLGIDSDYFRVGRIGSNVTNFIQLNSSDRKRLISRFLPNIDGYLNINSQVTTYLSTLRSQIKFVTGELDKIGDITLLNDKSDLIRTNITEKEEAYTSVLQEISVYQHKLNEAVKVLGLSYVAGEELPVLDNPYAAEVVSLTSQKTSISAFIEKYITIPENRNQEKIRSFIEDYRAKCAAANEALSSARVEVATINGQIHSLESEINSKKNFITNESQISGRISALQNQIQNIKTEYENAENYLAGFADKDVLEVVKAGSLAALYQRCDTFNGKRDRLSKFSADTFVSLYSNRKPEELIKEAKDALSEFEKNKTDLQTEQSIWKAEIMAASQLNQIKSMNGECGCKDPDCPYEKLIGSSSTSNSRLQELDGLIKGLTSEINECREYIEKIRSQYTALYAFCNEQAVELSKLIQSYRIDLYNEELKGFIDLSESEKICFIAKRYPDISYRDIYSTESSYNFIENNRGKIETLTESMNNLLSSKDMINAEKEQIAELSQHLQLAKDKYLASSANLEKVQKAFDGFKNTLQMLEGVYDKFSELDKVSNELQRKTTLMYEFEQTSVSARECLAELETHLTRGKELSAQIAASKKEYESVTINIARYKEYTEQREIIEADYNICNDVKYASDVVTGVPLYLTQGYLEEIRAIANPLLDVAYNGGFRLEPFEVTDKDFFIPIRKRSQFVATDICEASQGEVAFTKTAISLAIFKRAMTRYNIPSLDEVDSELDGANRSMFIRVLLDQVRELNLEQVFVISHNNAFYEAPIGLICCADHGLNLEDPTFMSNKVLVKDCTV